MGKLTFVTFNNKGEYKGKKEFNYEGGKAYEGNEKAENYLRENKLYGHRLESFEGISFRKKEEFKQRLINLGWEFDNEILVDTEW